MARLSAALKAEPHWVRLVVKFTLSPSGARTKGAGTSSGLGAAADPFKRLVMRSWAGSVASVRSTRPWIRSRVRPGVPSQMVTMPLAAIGQDSAAVGSMGCKREGGAGQRRASKSSFRFG